MAYLIFKLWPWLLAAGAIGFATGWLACSPQEKK